MAIVFTSIDAATTQVTGAVLDTKGLVYGPDVFATKSGTAPNTSATLEGSLDGVSWFTIRGVGQYTNVANVHARYLRARLGAAPSGGATTVTIVVREVNTSPAHRVIQLLDNVTGTTPGPSVDLIGMATAAREYEEPNYSVVITGGSSGPVVKLDGSIDGVEWFEIGQQPVPMFRYVRARVYTGYGVSAQLAVARLS